jgi:hypothetical protein
MSVIAAAGAASFVASFAADSAAATVLSVGLLARPVDPGMGMDSPEAFWVPFAL